MFYIQKGRMKLSVLSEQGKEATIALIAPGDFFGRRMHRFRSAHPHGNCYRNYRLHCPED